MDGRVLCRVTVSLQGTRVGHHVYVDPADPTIAMYLDKGILVALEPLPEPAGGDEQPAAPH